MPLDVREDKRWREALEFYAALAHWTADGAIQTPGMHPLVESPAGVDKGARAREALSAASSRTEKT